MNKSINSILEGIRERLQPQEDAEVDFFPLDEAKANPEKAEKHFRSAEAAYKQGLELVKNVQAGKGTRSDLESARVLSIKVGEHIAKAKKYGYDPKKIALVQGNGSMVGPGAGAAKTLLNKYHHQASRMEKSGGGGSSAPASSGGKFDKLVAKLKSKPGVKDPEALAAWIGRKKYGKERFAKMTKESVDVAQMLVFEDVEDVLAFVEGLETLTEYEEPKGTYAKGDLTVEWPPDVDHDMSKKVKAIETKAGGLITINRGSYGSAIEVIFRMNGSAIEKMLGRKLRRVK